MVQSSDEAHDLELERLATSNILEIEWPVLRSHIHRKLLSTIPIFLSRGPPPPIPIHTSPIALGPYLEDEELHSEGEDKHTTNPDDHPPAESLLLSPSNPTIPLEQITPSASTSRPGTTPRSVEVEPSTSPSQPPDPNDVPASTRGGLIIPPFPPLDTSHRRRASLGSVSSEGGGSSGTKANGHTPSPMMPNRAAIHAAHAFDDEWDEDTVIGGKKLAGWMEEDEGRKEAERLTRVLDGMDYPPFTIQRLTELILSPTKQHATLGKFLRAVEKTLLVTSSHEPPTYTLHPSSTIPGSTSFFPTAASTSTSSSSSSDVGSEDSMIPPGSTPMFSPIPFLPRPGGPGEGEGEDGTGDVRMGSGGGGGGDEGLMSPLMLGESSGSGGGGGFRFESAPRVRSPGPEPEDKPDPDPDPNPQVQSHLQSQSQLRTQPEPQPSANTSTDPGHQSYLGRVDELDTGPITTTSTTKTNGHDPTISTSTSGDAGENQSSNGGGEGGNMTLHGMSDRPVPISSTTTVVGMEERRIAGIPGAGAGAGGGGVGLAGLGERFVSAGSGDKEGEREGEGEKEI